MVFALHLRACLVSAHPEGLPVEARAGCVVAVTVKCLVAECRMDPWYQKPHALGFVGVVAVSVRRELTLEVILLLSSFSKLGLTIPWPGEGGAWLSASAFPGRCPWRCVTCLLGMSRCICT